MKRSFIFGMIFLAAAALAQAYPWAITVNASDMSVSIVDLGMSPPKVYGPFFKGQLGKPAYKRSGNNHYDYDYFEYPGPDAAVTPDGRYALVSNHYGQGVYKIDLADPTHPVIVGAIDLAPYRPGNVRISPNGKYVVMGDCRYPNLMFIDIASFQNYSVYAVPGADEDCGTSNVAWGSDGIVFGYSYSKPNGNNVFFGKINADATGLISLKRMNYGNASGFSAVSPDLRTVVSIGYEDTFQIVTLRFDAAGNLIPAGKCGLPRYYAPSGIAFTRDGRKVLVSANKFYCEFDPPDRFFGFSIASSGEVNLEEMVDLYSTTDGYNILLGLEGLDISPDGRFAIIGFSETEWWDDSDRSYLQLVDLNNLSVSRIPIGVKYPSAVACFNSAVYPPSNAAVTRLSNRYIFYMPSINRLTWEANPDNFTPIIGYRLYRKIKTASDDSYRILAELPPTVFSFNDRPSIKNTDYSYRLTAVNAEGRESPPVEVSN